MLQKYISSGMMNITREKRCEEIHEDEHEVNREEKEGKKKKMMMMMKEEKKLLLFLLVLFRLTI